MWIKGGDGMAIGAKLIDFDEILCRAEENCPLAVEGQSLYYDSDHLSVYGSMTLYPEVKAGLGQ